MNRNVLSTSPGLQLNSSQETYAKLCEVRALHTLPLLFYSPVTCRHPSNKVWVQFLCQLMLGVQSCMKGHRPRPEKNRALLSHAALQDHGTSDPLPTEKHVEQVAGSPRGAPLRAATGPFFWAYLFGIFPSLGVAENKGSHTSFSIFSSLQTQTSNLGWGV